MAFANDQAGADTVTFDIASDPGNPFPIPTIRLMQGEIESTDAVTVDASASGEEGPGFPIVITGDAENDDAGDPNVAPIIDSSNVAATAAENLDDDTRIFNVTDADAATVLRDPLLTGCRTEGDNDFEGGIFEFSGGAVSSLAELTITDGLLIGNSTAGYYAGGGAVFGAGAVTLTDT